MSVSELIKELRDLIDVRSRTLISFIPLITKSETRLLIDLMPLRNDYWLYYVQVTNGKIYRVALAVSKEHGSLIRYLKEAMNVGTKITKKLRVKGTDIVIAGEFLEVPEEFMARWRELLGDTLTIASAVYDEERTLLISEDTAVLKTVLGLLPDTLNVDVLVKALDSTAKKKKVKTIRCGTSTCVTLGDVPIGKRYKRIVIPNDDTPYVILVPT